MRMPKDELKKSFEFVSSVNRSTKFTSKTSQKSLSFLDIRASLGTFYLCLLQTHRRTLPLILKVARIPSHQLFCLLPAIPGWLGYLWKIQQILEFFSSSPLSRRKSLESLQSYSETEPQRGFRKKRTVILSDRVKSVLPFHPWPRKFPTAICQFHSLTLTLATSSLSPPISQQTGTKSEGHTRS